MKRIEINRLNILSTGEGYQFIPIGDADRLFGNGGKLDQLKDRIFKRHSAPVEDFWATLGRQDGQAISWQGYILCSGTGNKTSTGISGEEVELLKKLHPEIFLSGQRALEKVLVFDHVKFDDNVASRQLRLSVMVAPGEGALVYYQHTTSDDPLSQGGDIEYIQPQENKNYNNNERDRLDYFFNVPSDLSAVNRFIVKVITYTRDATETPEDVLQRIEKPHRLLRYNADTNDFDVITSVAAADRKLKTLLLIHGTVSSTANSFKGIIDSGWLKQLIKEGTYGQIIALDHPTIFAGPAENVAQLVRLIGAGEKFTEKIHIITTSRGGLVGKTIVNDAVIDRDLFTVERVAAQACANGVEYFTTAEHISKGLSVLKMVFTILGREGLEIFSAIAQTGVDFFRNQPGCVAMTYNSPPLKAILDGTPANTGMRYFPITGNYFPDNFKHRVLNLMVKVVYRESPNDWVVGTTQQAIMPPANYAYGQTKNRDNNYYLATTFDSIHTLYLMMSVPPSVQIAQGIPQEAISKFLKDEYVNIL